MKTTAVNRQMHPESHQSSTTWSGIPLKTWYGPDDVSPQTVETNRQGPGVFPYTRGIHETMYRGRLWTRREVCGIGGPQETNERMLFLLNQGATAPNVILDLPSHFGIDPDHPFAKGEVGVTGVNISHVRDMEVMTRGLDLAATSMSLIASTTSAAVILAQYISVAKRQGVVVRDLRGSIQNDPLHMRYCGLGQSIPVPFGIKTATDIIEYTAREMPHWHPTTINLYDLREQGVTAAQEVGLGFSLAFTYIESALSRGLNIDEFAPRLSFYCSSHVDFFEEIAKLRAARRLWAKIMRERYGAKDPKSLQFKFAVHTAGVSLVPQEPLNNVVRIAYQALAAVLAGVQSLHCCSYDEPIALPTEEAHRLAIRTQQILAYETGVAGVADPLGGSYYLERLTDQIEEEAEYWIQQVDAHDGMAKCMESGWLDDLIESESLKRQLELETKEKVIVGVNEFQSSTNDNTTPGGVQRIADTVEAQRIQFIQNIRKERSQLQVEKALTNLRREADQGMQHNLIPAMIEAVNAGATVAEILGCAREAYGYPYDPFEIIPSPFVPSESI